MTGLSTGRPLVMKSVMAAAVILTVMCAMSDAASVNKRNYLTGTGWGNSANRKEENAYKESKEWKNTMEHSTNQFGHGPGNAPPHWNGMSQGNAPPHWNGMNPGNAPPNRNSYQGHGWPLGNNNNNDYYNPATGQYPHPPMPMPMPTASNRPQPPRSWDWMEKFMKGIHGNNPNPTYKPVATYPVYPLVPYPPPNGPYHPNVPYPPPSVPNHGTHFSYNMTKTSSTTHEVHGHIPFPPKVVPYQPPQPWYGNQVRTTPTPYYVNNRDPYRTQPYRHNPRYNDPGHVALAGDYGRHRGQPSNVAGFY